MTNWNGDRALGFMVGVGASLMIFATLQTGSLWPAVGYLALMAFGVFVPRLAK